MVDAPGWRPLATLPRRPPSAGDVGARRRASSWQADALVALRGHERFSQAHFAGAVAAWRDTLAVRPGARWALYTEDAFDFASALFGAWHAGKTVVVPGDMQDDTVARLRAATDGFLGDLPGALARPGVDATTADALDWRDLDEEATQLVVYTSGTSGEPLAITKRLAQLAAEVQALEARFGALCDSGLAPVNLAPETVAAGDAVAGFDEVDANAAYTIDGLLVRPQHGADPLPVVWATVSHQHIYGLLFRVLWPLAAGRTFVAERLLFNEEIALRIAGPAVLVASPAHLRRLPDVLDWTAARDGLRAVFSSGGPLPPEAAENTLALLGAAPVEVYGSSETGGVAWRQRARHGDTWQPLPGIEFRIADGELSVRSPHLPDAQWWRTADRASAAGDGMDGFELQGRADRIVKIEEKRVSLSALEQRLRESANIAEARVLMLAADDAPADAAPGVDAPTAPVARPAVVAVLSASGRERLARAGKAAIVADLRASLLAAVDRVALPRRWRFVDALPIDAQGKSTEALLAAQFAPPRTTAARALRPALTWRLVEPDHAVASFDLTPDLVVFDGHFPGRAILPGVAQVDWAVTWARERFALPPVFVRLEALKFSQPVGPGTRMEIEWRWNAAAGALQFEFRSDAGRHSAGRAVFADAVTPVARELQAVR